MSLIRCLSNHEGLYVYGNGNNIIIASGRGWHLSNIGPDQDEVMSIPEKTFFKVCRKADLYCEDSVEIDGFRVSEEYIYYNSGRLAPKGYFPRTARALNRAAPTMWAVKLTYKDRYVYLYRVTWDYLRRSARAVETADRRRSCKTTRRA